MTARKSGRTPLSHAVIAELDRAIHRAALLPPRTAPWTPRSGMTVVGPLSAWALSAEFDPLRTVQLPSYASRVILWKRTLRWIDADIAASFFNSAPPSLAVGLLPLVVLAVPAMAVPPGSRQLLLGLGLALLVAWAVIWLWRALLYVRSDDFRDMLRRARGGQ